MSKKEIEIMKEGGKILSFILQKVSQKAEKGVTTKALNNYAEKLIKEKKVKPSFKNYNGFPFSLCTSLNEEIVHGLPSERKLKNGDVLSLDLGVEYKGYHTDMAVTLPIGKVDPKALRLIKVVKETLFLSLKEVYPGNYLSSIGKVIEKNIEKNNFSVVKQLCGHFIGKEIHQDPNVLNFEEKDGLKLKEGMVFCIEPMASLGKGEIRESKYGYGYETIDNSLSAHFEVTVVVVRDGCQVLTKLL